MASVSGTASTAPRAFSSINPWCRWRSGATRPARCFSASRAPARGRSSACSRSSVTDRRPVCCRSRGRGSPWRLTSPSRVGRPCACSTPWTPWSRKRAGPSIPRRMPVCLADLFASGYPRGRGVSPSPGPGLFIEFLATGHRGVDMSQRVLIVGATSAIAEAVARRYAAEGASLFLAARNTNRAAAIADDLRVRGATAVTVGGLRCDGARHGRRPGRRRLGRPRRHRRRPDRPWVPAGPTGLRRLRGPDPA